MEHVPIFQNYVKSQFYKKCYGIAVICVYSTTVKQQLNIYNQTGIYRVSQTM
jgi:hypothetical protein